MCYCETRIIKYRYFDHGKRSRCVIAKPEDGSQGDGILVAQRLADLKIKLRNYPNTSAVVQKYVKRPLLLDGFKFDFRIYVIVVGLGVGQRVFLCEEGLARFCTEKYQVPSKQKPLSSKDLLAHLTNYSLNKRSEKYVHSGEVQSNPEDDSSPSKHTEDDSKTPSKTPSKTSSKESVSSKTEKSKSNGRSLNDRLNTKSNTSSRSPNRKSKNSKSKNSKSKNRAESSLKLPPFPKKLNATAPDININLEANTTNIGATVTQVGVVGLRRPPESTAFDAASFVNINKNNMDIIKTSDNETSSNNKKVNNFENYMLSTGNYNLDSYMHRTQQNLDIPSSIPTEKAEDDADLYDSFRDSVTNLHDAAASKRTVRTVLDQLESRYPGFDREEHFYGQLEEIASQWISCMNPVLGATWRLLSHKKSTSVKSTSVTLNKNQNKNTNTNNPNTNIPNITNIRNANNPFHPDYYYHDSSCAQILGFDVMLDEDYGMHLLEVNNSPSLALDEIIPADLDEVEQHKKGKEQRIKEGYTRVADGLCTCMDHHTPHRHER